MLYSSDYFVDWENASRLIDGLRKENLEPYWIEKQSRSWGTIYLIFSGSFKAKNEAVKFMKDKDILKNYPDSFVRHISEHRNRNTGTSEQEHRDEGEN